MVCEAGLNLHASYPLLTLTLHSTLGNPSQLQRHNKGHSQIIPSLVLSVTFQSLLSGVFRRQHVSGRQSPGIQVPGCTLILQLTVVLHGAIDLFELSYRGKSSPLLCKTGVTPLTLFT